MGRRKKKLPGAWSVWDDHDLGLDLLLALEPQPPRPPSVLPHFPEEVSKRLADMLDHESATNLLVTCKALSVAGEMRSWRVVGYSINPHGKSRFHSGRQTDSAVHASGSFALDDEHPFHLGLVQWYSTTLRSSLIRLGSVTRLSLAIPAAPDGPMASALLDLIELCAPRIECLQLVCRPLSPNGADDTAGMFASAAHFYDRIAALANAFKRMTIFVIQPSDNGVLQRSLLELLRSLRTVKMLEYVLAPAKPTQDTRVPLDFPLLDHIETLSIKGIIQSQNFNLPIIETLLLCCRNARDLRLGGSWGLPHHTIMPITDLLVNRKLEYTCVTNAQQPNFPSFSFWWSPDRSQKVKLLAVRGAGALAKHPGNLLTCVVAGAPRSIAEVLVIDHSTKVVPKAFPYIVERPEWECGGFPSARTAQSLGAVPNLTVIRTASYNWAKENFYEYTPHTKVGSLNDSASWAKDRVVGMLIRGYANEENGECFYHIRVLRVGDPDIQGEEYRAYCRVWLNRVIYREKGVPPGVWLSVYDKAGMRYQWRKGRRRMDLPEVGWEVLENWYAQTGTT